MKITIRKKLYIQKRYLHAITPQHLESTPDTLTSLDVIFSLLFSTIQKCLFKSLIITFKPFISNKSYEY